MEDRSPQPYSKTVLLMVQAGGKDKSKLMLPAFKKEFMKRELDQYELWQLEKYGNILPSSNLVPESELFESGIDELERLAEWIDMQAEKELEPK